MEQSYTVEVSGKRFDVKVIGPPLAASGAGQRDGPAAFADGAVATRRAPRRGDARRASAVAVAVAATRCRRRSRARC